MQEESPVVVCSSCKSDIACGVFFCPLCGSAQLQAMLTPGNTRVANATTANYDPFAPDCKPWRETDHLLNKPHPKMPPQIGGKGSSLDPINPVPWRPTMQTYIHGVGGDKKKRQLEGIKRKELILKNSNRKLLSEDQKAGKQGKRRVGGLAAGSMASTEVDANGEPIPMDCLPPGHHGAVVYFKQHAFQRRHGKRKPAVYKQPDPIAKKAAEEALSDQHYEKGEQTLVHAIAAYDATWLVEPGYTIHVSLIDRHHEDRDDYITRYYLRVGIVYEYVEHIVPDGADPNTSEPEEVVTSSDLMVLEVLQNDMSHLLTNPTQYWVDLNLIKPDEYYMSTFLQQSLAYIAQRVHVSPSLTLVNLIDQVCLVEPVYDTEELELAQGTPQLAVITEQDLSLFKRRHKRALKKQKRENAYARAQQRQLEEEAQSRVSDGISTPVTSPKVTLAAASPNPDLPPLTPGRADPHRTQRKSGLANGSASGSRPGTATATTIGTKSDKTNRSSSVALGPPGREMNLVLEKTIAQRACRIPIGQIWEDQQVLGVARLSVRYPDAEELLYDKLPRRTDDDGVLFSEVKATQLVIHILPMYSPALVLPKMVSFDVSTLKVLLGEEIDIDANIKEGFQTMNKLLQKIIELLHFYKSTSINEHTGDDAVVEETYKVGITGVGTIAFDKPPVDYDSDSDSEEVAGVATSDCLAEIAKEIVTEVSKEILIAALEKAENDRVRAEEERIAMELLHKTATTRIQTLLRGKITRSRNIIQIKRQIRDDLRKQAAKGALAMQCCIRKFLAKTRVSNKRAAIKRAKLDAEMAEKWIESMGMHLEVEVDPENTIIVTGQEKPFDPNAVTFTGDEGVLSVTTDTNDRPQSASRSPNKDAIEAWRDAYERRSREGSPNKSPAKLSPPRWDECLCHRHPTYRYQTELKDTEINIAGLYNCSGICEHSIRGDRAAIKTMYTDPNSMIYMTSRSTRGDGLWNLVLTVVEVPDEGEGGDELQAQVVIDSTSLEEIAANLNHEITMMALENAEKDELDKQDAIREAAEKAARQGMISSAEASLANSIAGSRRGSNLLLTYEEELLWAREEKEQLDWENEVSRNKTTEEIENEAKTNAKIISEQDQSLSEKEKEVKEARVTLHNLLLYHEHKKEIFRRACAGITISWRYDGVLEAQFDLDTVMEMYEVFYDDEGDLVVGI
jgi:hypothetical protein